MKWDVHTGTEGTEVCPRDDSRRRDRSRDWRVGHDTPEEEDDSPPVSAGTLPPKLGYKPLPSVPATQSQNVKDQQ